MELRTEQRQQRRMNSSRPSSQVAMALEDRFERIKEIGDGSFGVVELARVRTAGSNVARRGTMVAIKTMKKTFDSFAPCLELREVIFLRTLPAHPHLVPALDIFLDPFSKKLHICMEYMDGNLYQLMKARDHKCMDSRSVKSILFQIMSGLNHIHAHDFFHRDIKPENILVTSSAPQDATSTFSRYSGLATPPSTPPAYTIKIADFGLARETHSRLPYTTYVSTRWYRAPEVLLRAGEYSAPVDIWAVGAMAVEIATLKPLFPGGNEVDQVWRVCEIMGSPGNWYSKSGTRVGGGEWRDGTRLAQKLGFSFPKMAPHSIDTILQQPQWPASFSNFVTWCLMWDPRNRPTSKQALEHEFFTEAHDPLRPRSSTTRLLGRKQSEVSFKSTRETIESPPLNSKPSWFRRSLIGRDSAPAVPQHDPTPKPKPEEVPIVPKVWPVPTKRSARVNPTVAPIPILPTIKPVSPVPNKVTAQARQEPARDEKKKVGRQLSLNSQINHYPDPEKGLAATRSPISPLSAQRESFFSHLRKRARRFSGRNITSDDLEAAQPWSNRSSLMVDNIAPNLGNADFTELDKALQNVRYSLENPNDPRPLPAVPSQSGALKRQHSNGPPPEPIGVWRKPVPGSGSRYETPEEEDELLDEALNSAHMAAARLAQPSRDERKLRTVRSVRENIVPSQGIYLPRQTDYITAAYPTPSTSAKRNSVIFGQEVSHTTPLPIVRKRQETDQVNSLWPTPPYDENEWGAAAAASIFAAGMVHR